MKCYICDCLEQVGLVGKVPVCPWCCWQYGMVTNEQKPKEVIIPEYKELDVAWDDMELTDIPLDLMIPG